jgi:HSP20 family protein
MPEVFNDFFDTDFMPRTNATAPAINVKETEHDYTVELAAAGMKKDDFNINIDADGNLHIKMEKKNEKKDEDKKEHYLRREFSYTKFEQSKAKGHSASSGVVIPLNDGLLSIIGEVPTDKNCLIFDLSTYESCCKSVKRWIKRAVG